MSSPARRAEAHKYYKMGWNDGILDQDPATGPLWRGCDQEQYRKGYVAAQRVLRAPIIGEPS